MAAKTTDKYITLLSLLLAAVVLCCSCVKTGKENNMNFSNFTYTERKKDTVTKSAACSFTDEEIEEQIEKGKRIVEEIYEAADDLSVDTFMVPAGDYGFEPVNFVNQVYSALYLHDIERPDDNPLTINCEGVTFWVRPTGLACANTSRAFHLQHCSNIRFVGLTIDEYSPTDYEGVVTQIDYENNRIAIMLNGNSMEAASVLMKRAVNGSQSRIIPFKANGDFISAYYRIDESWGPGALWVSDFQPTGKENECWLVFQSDLLLKTNKDPEWIRTYGSAGIIETGDVISYLYANMLITLDDCRQITMERLTSRLSKGMPSEVGGYGNHLWKDCVFGPEEGTGKYISASEFMLNGTRHGSTIDGCVLYGSSDDQINIHGYWGKITSIEDNGYINITNASVGLLEGDPIELYDGRGNLVSVLTVAETPRCVYGYDGFFHEPIKVAGDIPSDYRKLTVRYPSMSCDGWTIKNCTFINNYQRLLIQSGSGTFENNKIILMGDNVSLESVTGGYMEGTFIGDVTFRDNVFVSSAVGQAFCCFSISQTREWGNGHKTGTITLEHNAFVNCGNLISANNVSKLILKDNIIIEPCVINKTFYGFDDLLGEIVNVDEKIFENNLLLCSAVSEENDSQKNISSVLAEKARLYVKYSENDAKTIVSDLWNSLAG